MMLVKFTYDRIPQKIILKSGHVPSKRFTSPALEEWHGRDI